MSNRYESFSVRLRELREERGLTQGELAAALGMGQSAVANYERGSRFPDERTLKQMAAFFRASFDYLLGGNPVRGGESGADTAAVGGDTGTRPDIVTLRTSVGDLLLAGRLEEGRALALDAVHRGSLDLASLYEQVLTPVLHRAGDLWERGDIDVFQEHLCSGEIVRIMAEAAAVLNSGKPKEGVKRRACVVCAAPYGEGHFIALRMICDLFRLRGWNAWFLGTDTPTSDILKACRTCKADFLALSATMAAGVEAARNVIEAARNDPKLRNLFILVGGAAFDRDQDLWKKVGADGYAAQATESIEAVEKVLPSLSRRL